MQLLNSYLDGTTTSRKTPTPIATLDKTIVKISAGAEHTLMLSADGVVYGFGNSQMFTIPGTIVMYPIPINVSEPIKAISSSSTHSLLLSRNGTVYSIGSNDAGQLGDGTTISRYTPTKVINIQEPISEISTGSNSSHSIVLVGTWTCNGILKDNACSVINGTCKSQDFCLCNPGYGGTNCEIYNCSSILYSDPRACGNGTCIRPNECRCNRGYYGPSCDFWSCYDKQFDANDTCSDNGVCVAPNTCICNPKFSGNECEKMMCGSFAKSDPQVCSGRGVCIDHQCQCSLDYSGMYCEKYLALEPWALALMIGGPIFVGLLLVVPLIIACVCHCMLVYRRKKREEDALQKGLLDFYTTVWSVI